MAGFSFNPASQGKWAADMWGYSPRQDFVQGPGGRWIISGSSELQPGAYDPATAGFDDPGSLFDSREAAQAWINANRQSGPSPSQRAYSASLQAQGIPESELPYGSGQLRTFLAQAGRGRAPSQYLQDWARQTPGAWAQIGGRMMNERPPALAEILKDKQDPETWTAERQREALIAWLMQQYGGGMKSPINAQ